jgi:dipeptidyl aminopeptidase/acylaminoacyl peptidase
MDDDLVSVYAADLAVVNVEDGRVVAVVRGRHPFVYRVSSDNRFVVFTSVDRPTPSLGNNIPFDICVASLGAVGTLPVETIASTVLLPQFGESIVWSPRGATLLFGTVDSAGHDSEFVADAPTWHRSRLTVPARGASASGDAHPGGALTSLWWSSDGSMAYVLSPTTITAFSVDDGRVRGDRTLPDRYRLLGLVGTSDRSIVVATDALSPIAIVTNDSTLQSGFAQLNLRTGDWSVLREQARSYETDGFVALDANPRTQRVVYVAQDAQHPADLWQSTTAFRSEMRVTRIAPALDGYTYGGPRLVQWRTRTGTVVRGALLLPSNYESGRRYPMVVYPYPTARRSELLNRFGLTGLGVENMQLLATRGFAVLAPDAPIETQHQLRDLADVIMPGVDQAIEIGIADSSRIGIVGHSWGGYAVLALLVQTSRFRAAVMRGGEGDMVGSTGRLSSTGVAGGLLIAENWLGGLPWAERDRYIENSPMFFLDRVRTPLLIVHGEDDQAVPIILANEVYAGLQRLGRDVEFARYAGEEHFEASWSYANQCDYLRRMVGWFGDHLADGAPMEQSCNAKPAHVVARSSR